MTLTKRDLVIQITEQINRDQEKLEKAQSEQPASAKGTPGRKKQDRHPVEQRLVFDVVQKTLDGITRALASGQKVELRNFGVFEIKVRKARVGRNPNAPSTDVPIPARSVVKFKAGKEMRAEVLKLPAKPAPQRSQICRTGLIAPAAVLPLWRVMDRLPGFRDFYPEPLPHPDLWSAELRQYIFDQWRTMARRYGFREYDGPPLEGLELFTTKSGDEIVGQLYNFKDKGEREVSLRPEMTPTLARMIAAHERSYKKPVKWFAIPQLFRYERQQKGRLREHFQFNADIVGETDTAADAELIALLIDTLRSFGLTGQDFVIRLSSRNAWHDFFAQRNGDPTREYEFFQIIDKLEREAPEQSEEKLNGLGFSRSAVAAFIEKGEPSAELGAIVSNLAARGLGDFVKIDYQVIRGLAYYTGIVFEAFDRKREFRAIAGGGRYDNLVKLMSGGKVDLPALGFGMGDVVLAELLKARKLVPSFDARLDAFCLIETESLRTASLKLVQELRSAGLSVDYSLTAAKSDKQFKRAQELRAAHTIKLEATPADELTVRIRNLKSREEWAGNPAEVVSRLQPKAR